MKKNITFILILLSITGLAFGKDRFYSPAFSWTSPEVKAQGGSFIANGSGYNSLLVNPASFAKTTEKEKKDGEVKRKGELTLISIGAGFSGELFQLMEDTRDDAKNPIELILDQVTSNGIGASVQFGSGYVGKGLGIGFMSVTEMNAPQAETTLGVTGDIIMTNGLILGYAHPFELGQFKLVVGGDIRPMHRIFINDINIRSFTDSLSGGDSDVTFDTVDAMGGFGVGFDLGVDFYWRDLIASMTMRDIGNTRYFFKSMDTLFGMQFSGNSVDDIYVTPWTLNFGVAYSPTMGKINRFIDPTIHASWSQPLVKEDSLYGYSAQSFWTRLDMGAEIVLLSSVALRAGFQGGYFTAGFGLDLFFLELNGALYSEELGTHAGDKSSMGGSMEVAFRF